MPTTVGCPNVAPPEAADARADGGIAVLSSPAPAEPDPVADRSARVGPCPNPRPAGEARTEMAERTTATATTANTRERVIGFPLGTSQDATGHRMDGALLGCVGHLQPACGRHPSCRYGEARIPG